MRSVWSSYVPKTRFWRRQTLALTTVATLAASACVTPRREQAEVPSGPEKAGTKLEHPLPATTINREPAAPSLDDQLAFVRRESAPEAPFGAGERQFLASLPATAAPGSITEAAIAVGIVKSVLHPAVGTPNTFQEADLSKAPAAAPGAKAGGAPAAERRLASLEQQCKERGLNLVMALSDNSLLATAGVAKQVAAALKHAGNSKEFTSAINDALKKQARLWNEVAGGIPEPAASPESAPMLGPPPPPLPPAPPASDAATQQAAAGPGGNVPTLLPAGGAAGAAAAGAGTPDAALAAGTPGGENTLAAAQSLADRGDFAGAIKIAQGIPESQPQGAQAKEKVKEFSNLAVQELRRKAAQAYQSAMPANDPKTRAEYLKQAKGYLEEAIKDYPEATQLPTVRENLRIISRDLEKL